MENSFQTTIYQAVIQFAENDKESVIEEFRSARLASIFTERDNVHLFFREEVDIPAAEISGAGASIAIRCRELISKYDEFGFTKSKPVKIFYSSQEIIARNGGNLMYLLR